MVEKRPAICETLVSFFKNFPMRLENSSICFVDMRVALAKTSLKTAVLNRQTSVPLFQ